MTGPRVLAIFVAACALAASALIAMPMDEQEGPTASISLPASRLDTLAARRPQLAGTEAKDDTHTAIPRLWLR
jgi:hypothetical protein